MVNQEIKLHAATGDTVERTVRNLVNETLADYRSRHGDEKGGRATIAKQLTLLAGREISLPILNAYASLSDGTMTARFPAALILPLAEITGDDRLQRFVMGERLLKLLEYAEAELRGLRGQRELGVMRESLLARFEVKGGAR